jgi:hypothetical protein
MPRLIRARLVLPRTQEVNMAPPRRYEDSVDYAVERPKSSNALVWLAGCGVLSFGFFACMCAGVAGYLVWRHDLTNTSWRGNENLAGFGALRFEFKKNNVVIMTDAQRVVQGTWSRQDSNVVLTFANCQYRGTIDGNIITGTAQYTDPRFGLGAPAWAFSVARE